MELSLKEESAGVSTERIVAGIFADADAEAARMVAEAESLAAAALDGAREQILAMERDAKAKTDAQVATIAADAKAKAAIESRKNSLLLQESLSREIVGRATAVIADEVRKSGYREVLRGLLTEAAIGLSVESASVNASMEELPLMDDALLRQVEADVLAATGKQTRLSRVSGDPRVGQGVYLVAEGGRLAYDNGIATRLERERTEIRKRIYQALFDSRIA
ncbi:MAG: hypothetical protein CVV51_14560 [Spirochaetae bacterium HGW-Spirochaetae-7]|jgi:vacuolar-type H+-ATPase subunit E/Vma4|nr:MAG: hypothetical protein CVV51_14560 [Spirochaetae bacterium HGW-Spirochaetae-7]